VSQEKTFDDELRDLQKDDAILLGMQASLSNFQKKHQEQINAFCKKHLEVTESGAYTLIDMIARARKIK
jgi:hypothetical protein